jgi:hypothetical protein
MFNICISIHYQTYLCSIFYDAFSATRHYPISWSPQTVNIIANHITQYFMFRSLCLCLVSCTELNFFFTSSLLASGYFLCILEAKIRKHNFSLSVAISFWFYLPQGRLISLHMNARYTINCLYSRFAAAATLLDMLPAVADCPGVVLTAPWTDIAQYHAYSAKHYFTFYSRFLTSSKFFSIYTGYVEREDTARLTECFITGILYGSLPSR